MLGELGLSRPADEIASRLRDQEVHPSDREAATDPTTARLDAVAGGVRVVFDLGRRLTVGMPQSPNHPAYWHASRAATATWSAPTAARPPTT